MIDSSARSKSVRAALSETRVIRPEQSAEIVRFTEREILKVVEILV